MNFNKLRNYSVVLFILLSFTCKIEAKKITCQIFLENDTLTGVMKVPTKLFSGEVHFERLQYRVKFFDSDGVKKKIYPDQAKEVRFKHKYETIRMLSRKKSRGMGSLFSVKSNIFLHLEVDGPVQLFNYYYTQNSAGSYNASTGMTTGGYSYTVEKYILQKGDGELKRPKGLGFKKDMIEFFSDCAELVQKIENKEFRKNDLIYIVEFYNRDCH